MSPETNSTEARWRRADRCRLQRALAKAKLARDYRRIEAVLWIAEGQPIGEVAQRAHVDRTSVHRWRERYLQGRDPGALADRPRSGRPPLAPELSGELLAELLA